MAHVRDLLEHRSFSSENAGDAAPHWFFPRVARGLAVGREQEEGPGDMAHDPSMGVGSAHSTTSQGILYKKRDGTFVRLYFRLATVTVDLPEICLMLCIYQAFASATRPNPSCTCLRVDFLNQTASHTCTSKKRKTRKMRDILERGDSEAAKDYSFTMQEVSSRHC